MFTKIAAAILMFFYTFFSGIIVHSGNNIVQNDIDISNGNRIIEQSGIALQAWVPSSEAQEKCISSEELEALGFGPTYYEGNLFNSNLQLDKKDFYWSIAQAPNLGYSIKNNPTAEEWLSAEQLNYADSLISVCFGDEQEYSTEQTEQLNLWFDDFRSRHTNTLLHTNQWAGQWSAEQYEEYLRIAHPDILTMDAYYFTEKGDLKDYEMSANIADTINVIRIPAMKGYDGTGSSPIPFGQYLLGYRTGQYPGYTGWYEVTESQINLVSNLTLTMGGKWLNLFRILYYEPFLLFDENGNTTRHYDYYAALTSEIKNLSPHLSALQTTDVRVVKGQHKKLGVVMMNRSPKTISLFSRNQLLNISDIKVTNLGTQNDSLPGDVYLGFFKPLNKEGEYSARDYFAVCNALATGNGVKPENQHGCAAETSQRIELTFDKDADKKLFYVDEKTGMSKEVETVNGKVSFDLGGGKMRLFYFE